MLEDITVDMVDIVHIIDQLKDVDQMEITIGKPRLVIAITAILWIKKIGNANVTVEKTENLTQKHINVFVTMVTALIKKPINAKETADNSD